MAEKLEPTILFFRHHPGALAGSVALASSIQSLETSFFLIALDRFPHALSACAAAIETAIRASDVGAKKGDSFQCLLEKAKAKSEKIAEFPGEALDRFRKVRNRVTHSGFIPTH